MNSCNRCGAAVEPGAVICVWCGAAAGDSREVPAIHHAAMAPVPAQSMARAGIAGDTSNLSGIRGWLILFAVGLAIEPLALVRRVLVELRFLNSERYHDFLMGHPALYGLLVFEAISGAMFLIALIALNVAFYKRKKLFPFWIIAVRLAQCALLAITQLWMFLVHYDSARAVILSGLGVAESLIWIAYLLRSRRVKQTFVN